MNRSRLRRLLWLIPCFVIAGLGWYIPNASRPGSEVEGCLDGCAAARRQGNSPLRVASINVLHDFPDFDSLSRRLDLIAEEILRMDADIVLLQEIPW
ncbi:MAG: endonuclease/exonuclease/phosphatase family protein, partial [Chloroflexota bacterium]